jgi:uncharacterized protein (DUF427 family)
MITGGLKPLSTKRIKPKPGQESVWDYPRPPHLEKCSKSIQVIFNEVELVNTTKAYRVLETSHPPVYYIPPEDIKMEYLIDSSGLSYCEWKGQAKYYSLKVGDNILEKVAWYYEKPTESFSKIKDYVAFYAEPMDACFVDGEKVIPQPGNFYGGWITKDVVGPFKGEAGTLFW